MAGSSDFVDASQLTVVCAEDVDEKTKRVQLIWPDGRYIGYTGFGGKTVKPISALGDLDSSYWLMQYKRRAANDLDYVVLIHGLNDYLILDLERGLRTFYDGDKERRKMWNYMMPV